MIDPDEEKQKEQEHAERKRIAEQNKKLQAAKKFRSLKEQGICTNCRKAPPEGNHVECSECRKKHQASYKLRYHQRKADGLCIFCDNPPVENQTVCQTCRDKRRRYCTKTPKRREKNPQGTKNTLSTGTT